MVSFLGLFFILSTEKKKICLGLRYVKNGKRNCQNPQRIFCMLENTVLMTVDVEMRQEGSGQDTTSTFEIQQKLVRSEWLKIQEDLTSRRPHDPESHYKLIGIY